MADFFNFPPINKEGKESQTFALINCSFIEYIMGDDDKKITVLKVNDGHYTTKWSIKKVWESVVTTAPKNEKEIKR